jgi:hypothetical protein
MCRLPSWAVLAMGLAVVAAPAAASSSNAPEFYLNTRGVLSCTACHDSSAPDSGPGGVRVGGVPDAYVPGQKYPIRVVVSHPGFKKWGFLLSATNQDGQQAGKLISSDPAIDLKVSAGVTFAKQSYNGTDSFGAARSWSLVWQAPASGSVKFSAQGVAADGSGHVKGDFCYSTRSRIVPAARAVAAD